MVAQNLCLVVLAGNQDAIELIGSNPYVLTNDGFAEELLIRPADYAILRVSLNPVEGNDGKGAVHFDAFPILEYHVAAYLRLTRQAHLHADSVLQYLVIN
jgi:hypothetical protein